MRPRRACRRTQRRDGAGGIHDRDVPAGRLVGVEHLCVRYLWDDAAYLWLTQKQSDEERFLSCSLNVTWPDQNHSKAGLSNKGLDDLVAGLVEIFDHMVVSTRVVTSRCHAEDHQFAGWLSYSSFDRSWKALKCLHDATGTGAGHAAVVAQPVHPEKVGAKESLPPRVFGKRVVVVLKLSDDRFDGLLRHEPRKSPRRLLCPPA